MKDAYIVNYAVKGIKSLDKLVTLSFYKKIISKNMNVQGYNVKGIYGMNGSGKSGIMTSVEIFRDILCNTGYLNNPIVQKQLDEIINKKLNELYIECDYVADVYYGLMLFKYELKLSKDITGKYVISFEKLSAKSATSKNEVFNNIFEVIDGEIVNIAEKDTTLIREKMVNLLSTSSMCSLYFEKVLLPLMKNSDRKPTKFLLYMTVFYLFANKIHVYMDDSDNHKEYFIRKAIKRSEVVENIEDKSEIEENNEDKIYGWLRDIWVMQDEYDDLISIDENIIKKDEYEDFEKTVSELYGFVSIFKTELKNIEIDKKEDENYYRCNLKMVYDGYKINTEFESTGIKKLIKLFAYIKEMVNGGIVFIDEFDSNLHDVYLCALLEYLMAYGKGQLCFTTHNVGPMDILKQNKKSIDFLSNDHKIYPWTTNGNYSPSKLYRNGMIEGSPFNVDSIDFISAFGTGEEDE